MNKERLKEIISALIKEKQFHNLDIFNIEGNLCDDSVEHITDNVVNHPEVEEMLESTNENKWVSVEDRLPIDYTKVRELEELDVILYADRESFCGEICCGSLPEPWYVWKDNDGDKIKPTHWMPLPQPPKQSEE